jgi:hypothetical protein
LGQESSGRKLNSIQGDIHGASAKISRTNEGDKRNHGSISGMSVLFGHSYEKLPVVNCLMNMAQAWM